MHVLSFFLVFIRSFADPLTDSFLHQLVRPFLSSILDDRLIPISHPPSTQFNGMKIDSQNAFCRLQDRQELLTRGLDEVTVLYKNLEMENFQRMSW